MSKRLTGSLCLTDINECAKNRHSAFTKGKNGKIYFNILQWLNDNPDQYGNDGSIQLNAKKDATEIEKKCYIGNVKYMETKQQSPISKTDAEDIPDDTDLPF